MPTKSDACAPQKTPCEEAQLGRLVATQATQLTEVFAGYRIRQPRRFCQEPPVTLVHADKRTMSVRQVSDL